MEFIKYFMAELNRNQGAEGPCILSQKSSCPLRGMETMFRDLEDFISVIEGQVAWIGGRFEISKLFTRWKGGE